MTERGQQRPADWPKEFVPLTQLTRSDPPVRRESPQEGRTRWVKVGEVSDFPADGGTTIKYGRSQIAVFRFESRGEWYACQNMCPHKQEMVLARGIIGDQGGVPKVACPLHKKTFSLESGTCLSGENYHVKVFPVKVEAGEVYLDLPPDAEFDESLQDRPSCTVQCV